MTGAGVDGAAGGDGRLVLAHAVGIRSDLPVELWVVLTAGALAVIVSFVALAALWHTPKLRGDRAGRPVPVTVQAAIDSPVLRWLLRLVVLVVALFVVVVALLGPRQETFNLSPYAFYITFWVGLVPASLLLGPVWRTVNPLRTLHRVLLPLTGPAPAADQVGRLGVYPAVAFIAAYAWLELVYPDRAVPQTVGVALVLYSAVQLVAALWYGEGWFERGEAFEVWSTLLGRFSVLGRREDGRLVLRNPLDGADGTPQVPGLALFAVVLLGSTAFDGVTRASWYQSRVSLDAADVGVPTTFLVLTVLVVAGLFYACTNGAAAIAAHRGVPPPAPTPLEPGGALLTRTEVLAPVAPTGLRRLLAAPEAYAHSLVPIAAGYAVAHYFSLLLLEGQLTWILASNPFAQEDVDLFGTYRNEVDLAVVSPGVISAVQVSAIILGHVVGVVLAHDRAVRDTRSARTALLSQLPLLAMMVAFTCSGLALLLG